MPLERDRSATEAVRHDRRVPTNDASVPGFFGGATGRVFATDIQPEMLSLLRMRMARARLDSVELVLSADADPRLPEGLLDLVLMVDVYHELARPQEVLRKLRASL